MYLEESISGSSHSSDVYKLLSIVALAMSGQKWLEIVVFRLCLKISNSTVPNDDHFPRNSRRSLECNDGLFPFVIVTLMGRCHCL